MHRLLVSNERNQPIVIPNLLLIRIQTMRQPTTNCWSSTSVIKNASNLYDLGGDSIARKYLRCLCSTHFASE